MLSHFAKRLVFHLPTKSSTQLHLHCMPAGLWWLCVYFFVVSISSDLLAAVATVYLHSFPSPGQQINIPIALYVGLQVFRGGVLVSCRREDHHDGQLRDLQGSLFGVFVARDRWSQSILGQNESINLIKRMSARSQGLTRYHPAETCWQRSLVYQIFSICINRSLLTIFNWFLIQIVNLYCIHDLPFSCCPDDDGGFCSSTSRYWDARYHYRVARDQSIDYLVGWARRAMIWYGPKIAHWQRNGH